MARRRQPSYSEELQRAESSALGSPLVIKIIGTVLCAVVTWTGTTVYDVSKNQAKLDVQLTNQVAQIGSLSSKVDNIIGQQYTKSQAQSDIGEVNAKIAAMESRVRSLETENAKSGSTNQLLTIQIDNLRSEINTLRAQLVSLTETLKKIEDKK